MTEPAKLGEFSRHTRREAIARLASEKFDLLIVGGGITGAASARDAARRGLKVALIEKNDFAHGTSSRSSKLIHGGLRYLQNLEFHLVFESLSERALLLKTVPNLVRPLPFYFPVYRGDPVGKFKLGMGMWLYDLLSMFRAPGFHKNLSKKALLAEIPFLKPEGLQGGFQYFDASMWDDMLAVETHRSAATSGAVIANYVEGLEPIRDNHRIRGFRAKDLIGGGGDFEIHASRVIIAAGPWTDELGRKLSPEWRDWLMPSKGVHLIFDLKRIPVPGAMVMTEADDGRISFVIPRPDYGAGVVIVGTTDGPTPRDPDQAGIDAEDAHYLLGLLNRYFPGLKLVASDILSAYVGVRPLVGPQAAQNTYESHGSPGGGSAPGDRPASSAALQKVSREHFIGRGPGGTVVVAGGKYTTARRMAQEIIDFTLHEWRKDVSHGEALAVPQVQAAQTEHPVNPEATEAAMEEARTAARVEGLNVPDSLITLYGREALDIARAQNGLVAAALGLPADPDGFPMIGGQLVHALRTGMVMRLEDFYFRRIPLYASRKDHGLPWADGLSRLWAHESGLNEADAVRESQALRAAIESRSAWMRSLSG